MHVIREKVRAVPAALSVALALAAVLLAAAQAAPAAAAVPSSCPSGSQPRTHYLTDFETADEEGAPSGWRAKRLYTPQGELPGAKGQLAGSHWHYPPSAPGKAPWSGQRNIWADTFPGGQVPETATSSAIEMQREVQLPEGARLGFIHRFDFTAEKTTAAGGEKVDDFGAGTVEFSLDGGGWADSRTFTGSVPGHRSSHFNLSEMAGKRLRLRFLLTTVTPPAGLQAPEAGAFRGWAIDDVHIYTCEKPPAAPGGQDPAEVVQPSQRGGPLEMKVMRRPRALRRGAKAVLRVAVANRSQTTLRRVRVCFRAPRRILTGPRCAVVRRLPSGTAADLEFRVQVASNIPSRRKRVRVAFAARTGGKQLIVASRRFKLLSD